jgi:hypothetical protein
MSARHLQWQDHRRPWVPAFAGKTVSDALMAEAIKPAGGALAFPPAFLYARAFRARVIPGGLAGLDMNILEIER